MPALSIVFTRKMLARTEFASARHVMTMMTPSGVTKPCGYCHRSQRKTHWQYLTFAILLLRDCPWACVFATSAHNFDLDLKWPNGGDHVLEELNHQMEMKMSKTEEKMEVKMTQTESTIKKILGKMA